MEILFVHNHYRQRSGEDAVYELDRQAAELAGHELVTYTRDNHELEVAGLLQQLSLTSSIHCLSYRRPHFLDMSAAWRARRLQCAELSAGVPCGDAAA